MAASLGSEAVGQIGEGGFVDGLQQHPNDFLHQLIVGGRDTQRALLRRVIFLGDVRPPSRIGLVGLVFQGFDVCRSEERRVVMLPGEAAIFL